MQDPTQFQVIVTNNLFGDIVTDLGAAFQGGLGHGGERQRALRRSRARRAVRAGARLGAALGGKDIANPFAALLTVGMMLAHLGWPEEERRIEGAVALAVQRGRCTRDVGGELGTTDAASFILAEVQRAPSAE